MLWCRETKRRAANGYLRLIICGCYLRLIIFGLLLQLMTFSIFVAMAFEVVTLMAW